ncbi:protein-glutamate methylesterase/protein-glutamine glutaminase [Methylophaga sp. OBS3]|uniref:protein-glutamate methylesterase/protein-glutamine glutaminase n=1 Tax=Methylophaga sp. OBS3 TaxID=2991934 RepID=UPI002258ABAA|nr:chemotaxis response regulator protein-glutamate methylesterase [Methylophaga sp. OBS3]MCX4188862.1 chemotaxis response regulator protein-glutamate methylesterase [Methylophaga sp. OBS3]
MAIKVLIIDDSALIRKLLTEIINSDPALEVIGTASDPYMARDKIKTLNPDVLTLDVEMPKMDGITFLRNLMRLRPMPVVMISSLTEHGADVTLDALSLGAFDFVSKPKLDVEAQLTEYTEEITTKVKAAFTNQAGKVIARQPQTIQPLKQSHLRTTEKIIAIGASTGGTEAIREVLCAMPADAPGIVITQHIPAAFSKAFANRVNGLAAMNVSEAKDGQQILPGHAYIAPGDQHLYVIKSGARYICKLDDGDPVNRHKPSVEVLFDSVARSVGPNAIGVMLTGMGEDGAKAMVRMREAGAINLIQDEATSVVWGMPGAAFKYGAGTDLVPLQKMAERIIKLV